MPSLYVKKYPGGRRQERACEQCGAAFTVPNRTVARGGGRYCSQACKHDAQRSRVEVQCEVCGVGILARPSDVQKGMRFCSWECRAQGMRGDGNPAWRGADPDYRGWDWESARQAALERDSHRCTECGSDEWLHVHHVVPWRESHDNTLGNLRTLCAACHTRLHKLAPGAPEQERTATTGMP